MTTPLGKAVIHEAAELHVTGAARYVDDLRPQLARLAYAWPVLSIHAHARVLSIDRASALKEPGVLAVLIAADVPGENDTGPARRDEPLFPTEVCHHAQPVAWVVATSEAAARAAAARVLVEYEPLSPILSIAAAIECESFLTDLERIRRGEPEEELKLAAQRLEGEIFVGGQEHFYLEPHAALATVEDSGAVFVEASTQHPAETQEIVARVLGIGKQRVTVQCTRMGGAFGGKEVQANAWAAVAALAATKLKRPVCVRLSRANDMAMTGKRHPFFARFRVGFGVDAQLKALCVELFSDGGHSLDLSLPVLTRAMLHIDNCYFIPHIEVKGRVCRTNHVSHTAFRGFGAPQAMLVIEDILDRIARQLELPPHAVRQRNFYRPLDRTHYQQPVRDADRIARVFAELKQSSHFDERLAALTEFNARHPHQKRGLAITPVKFGVSYTTAFFNQAGALVLIFKDGTVQINHGGTEMGQGLHTKIGQIAADALGLPLDAIRVMPTRTDKVPNTSATAASASTDLNGAAVQAACETLRKPLADIASRRLHVPPQDLLFEDGRISSKAHPKMGLSFSEVVAQAYLERIPLSATGHYSTPNLYYNRNTGTGNPFHYFVYGAAVSEVEVDAFTGQYRLRRVDILEDAGSSISPLIDRGQIEGGFMQGVGWLTSEELVWDEQGVLRSAGASTYKLPTLGECPDVFRVQLLARAAEPGVVAGSKAVGEPPLMLALSVREALRAAIAAFGPAQIVELPTPATPEAVFFAIERVRMRR